MKTAREIRNEFFAFFREKGHRIVDSAPVVPLDDPTLLFINAGMNQFKDVFLGTGSRDYTRCADTQKCIRVSGKHNDLEEVGVDTYHHTFFEMLGNWSFGDYFKKEAIAWAWELLVDRYGLDPERMYATVFEGDEAHGLPADTEAEALWPEMSTLPPERVLRGSAKDNFWEMGDVGPCGPLHRDPLRSRARGLRPQGRSRGTSARSTATAAATSRSGTSCSSSSSASRMAASSRCPPSTWIRGWGSSGSSPFLQGKASNYDIDLFTPILAAVAERAGVSYERSDSEQDIAIRVIADHCRALSTAIADGALPGKQGRGYVLRRLLRRAARYGRQTLGIEGSFLYEIIPVVAEVFSDVFPEIGQRLPHIQHVVKHEEESFAHTIDTGIQRFDRLAAKMAEAGTDLIPGDEAYRLYHQDGFPRDLIELMAREQGLRIDEAGWDAAEAAHKEASKGETSGYKLDLAALEGLPATEFLGYWEREQAEALGTRVSGLKLLTLVGTEALVLDRSPFYAEAGGQVGDAGVIEADGFRFRVDDTGRIGDKHVHYGELERGDLSALPAEVTAIVDLPRRQAIMANHTATHLLHKALKAVLGEHANQQGSLVHPDYLRFDFTHPESMTPAQIDEVERLVNQDIAGNHALWMNEESLEGARARGGHGAVRREVRRDGPRRRDPRRLRRAVRRHPHPSHGRYRLLPDHLRGFSAGRGPAHLREDA